METLIEQAGPHPAVPVRLTATGLNCLPHDVPPPFHAPASPVTSSFPRLRSGAWAGDWEWTLRRAGTPLLFQYMSPFTP